MVIIVLYCLNYEKEGMYLVLEPPEDLPPKPIKITISIKKMKRGLGVGHESRSGLVFILKVYALGPTVLQPKKNNLKMQMATFLFVFLAWPQNS